VVAVLSGLVFSAPTAFAADGTTELSSPVAATVVNVNTVLHIRQTPSTSASILQDLRNTTALSVTGCAPDGWVEVKTPQTPVGYADGFYVNVPVVSLSAATASQQVTIGTSAQMVMTIFPACASNLGMRWTSSDASVATVSSTGVVTATALGTTTVTGVTDDGAKTATTTVTVVPVPVTGVSVSPASTDLRAGGTAALAATVTPPDATDKNILWSSSDSAVASVSSSGLVTARGGGTATITATTAEGGKTAAVTVTVTVPVSSVSLPATASVPVAGTTRLVAAVSPSAATDKAVSWSSSNTAVATVSSAGLVTGRRVGTATVTATTADGAKTASVTVTVVPVTVPVAGVFVTPSSASVTAGGKVHLTASVTPSNATNVTVSWASSNTTVATVSGGVVTGKAAGKATITAKTVDGGKSASATVTVSGVAKPAVASALRIVGSMGIANPLRPGTPVHVAGTVLSNYRLTSVTAAIAPCSGAPRCSFTTDPNATSFNTTAWNNNLMFNTLVPGSYTYSVSARDASGASKTLRSTAFKVAAPAASRPGYVKVGVGGYLNLRRGASTAAAVLARLSCGTALTLGGKSGGWYAVTVGTGAKGYVDGEYISTSRPSCGVPAPVSHSVSTPAVSVSGSTPQISQILRNIENSTRIPASKKPAAVATAQVMLNDHLDVRFVAGMLANVVEEGNTGQFESSNYVTNPEPGYLYQMDHHYNYRNLYSGQFIYNKNLGAVNTMATTLNRDGWKIDGSVAGFGLGSNQWTWTRCYTLVQLYLQSSGGSNTITKQEAVNAEADMIDHEIKYSYSGIYAKWKAGSQTAFNAGYDLSRSYEVPAGGTSAANIRGSLAASIFASIG